MSQRFSKYYNRIPILLGLTMLVGLFIIGRSFFTFNLREIKTFTEVTGTQVAIRLEEQLNSHLQVLNYFRNQFNDHGIAGAEDFQEEAQTILSAFKGFQALNFIDTSGVIRWVVPLKGNEMVVGRDLHTHEFASATFARAEATRQDQITPPLALWQGGMGLATYYPIIHQGTFLGYINGVIRFNNFLDAYLHEGSMDQFHIVFEYENTLLYEVNGFPALPSLKLQTSHPVTYGDKTLLVSLSPHQSLIDHFKSKATIMFYLAGLVVSFLLPYFLHVALERQASLHDSFRALEESETRYREIFLHTHDAIYRTTLDGVLILANPAALKLLGTKEEDLGSINVRDLYRNEADREALVRRLLDEGQVINYEVPLVLPDGRHLDCLLSTSVVRDEAGTVTGFQGIVQDITRLKEQERQLKEALKREQEARQVITNIVFNLSHEIRTPLNSILGYAEMLKDGLGERLSEEQEEQFQILKENGARLSRTISEILDYAAVSAGNYEQYPETLNLVTVVEEALAEYEDITRYRNNQIFFTRCEDCTIEADKYMVQQIVHHLIHNALVYTEAGRILITLSPLETAVRLRIQDEGRGMKKAFQKHMFDLFAQESTGQSRRFEGLGLGLSLVKLYVDALQGRLNITSTAGKGTMVVVELPRKPV